LLRPSLDSHSITSMLCRTYVATASTTSTIESSIHPPLLDGLSSGLSTKLVITQGCGQRFAS
jgi:hypothetical protein